MVGINPLAMGRKALADPLAGACALSLRSYCSIIKQAGYGSWAAHRRSHMSEQDAFHMIPPAISTPKVPARSDTTTANTSRLLKKSERKRQQATKESVGAQF